MPRKPRIEIAGFHHIVNRGVNKTDVFYDDEDRDYFINNMCRVFNTNKIILHSYSLMSNHYHLLISNEEENLSQAMREVNSQYSFYFNKKYERIGHLWQERFKSYYILDDTHFMNVFKYIERNALDANIVSNILKYPYQSLKALIGLEKLLDCMKENRISDFISKDEILEFVESTYSDDFENEVYRDYPKGELSSSTKPIGYFFNNDKERVVSIIEAMEHGYTKKAIGRYLDTTAYAITKELQKAKE